MSDVLLGNEPNVIPFETGDKGPQEYAPGYLAGDPYVIPSGAPGPITCGENWVGVAQVLPQSARFQDVGRPGNPDAPGMNVDCAGDEKPHQP